MLLRGLDQRRSQRHSARSQADVDDTMIPVAGAALHQLISNHPVEKFGHRGLLKQASSRQIGHLRAGLLK